MRNKLFDFIESRRLAHKVKSDGHVSKVTFFVSRSPKCQPLDVSIGQWRTVHWSSMIYPRSTSVLGHTHTFSFTSIHTCFVMIPVLNCPVEATLRPPADILAFQGAVT